MEEDIKEIITSLNRGDVITVRNNGDKFKETFDNNETVIVEQFINLMKKKNNERG